MEPLEGQTRKFRITDPATGRSMVVSGESPPTQEEVAELFAAIPAGKGMVNPAGAATTDQPSEAGVGGRFARGLVGFAGPDEAVNTVKALGQSVREDGVGGTFGNIFRGMGDAALGLAESAAQKGVVTGGPFITPRLDQGKGAGELASGLADAAGSALPGQGPYLRDLGSEMYNEPSLGAAAEIAGNVASLGLPAAVRGAAGAVGNRATRFMEGVRLTPGQRRGGMVEWFEGIARKFPVTSGRWKQITTRQQLEATKRFDDYIGEISQGAQTLPNRNFGQAVRRGVQDAVRSIDDAFAVAYDDLDQIENAYRMSGGVPDVAPMAGVKNRASELLGELQTAVSRSGGGPGNALEGVISDNAGILGALSSGADKLTFGEAHRLRSLLLDISRSKETDALLGARRAREIRALVPEMDEAMKEAARGIGGDRLANHVTDLGREYAKSVQSLSRNAIVRLVKDNKAQPSQVIDTLTSLATTPEDHEFLRGIIRSELPPKRADSLERLIRARIINDRITGSVDTDGFGNAAQRLTPADDTFYRPGETLADSRKVNSALAPRKVDEVLDVWLSKPEVDGLKRVAKMFSVVDPRNIPESGGLIGASLGLGLVSAGLGALTGGLTAGGVAGLAGTLAPTLGLELVTRIAARRGGVRMLEGVADALVDGMASGTMRTATRINLVNSRLNSTINDIIRDDPEFGEMLRRAMEEAGGGTVPFNEVGARPSGTVQIPEGAR